MVNLVDDLVVLDTFLENIFDVLGSPSLLCVLGNHLLIHLREAAEEGRNEGTSFGLKSPSGIHFGQVEEFSEFSEHRYSTHSRNSIA